MAFTAWLPGCMATKNADPATTPAPYDSYLLSLTPGQWLLHPGFQTVFGSVVDPTGTTISIASHGVTSRNLTLPYHVSTQAAVTGTVAVVGAPADDLESGVRACTAEPTATSCAGRQEAFAEERHLHRVARARNLVDTGIVDVFFGFSSTRSTSTAIVVRAQPGIVTTKNFVVALSQ